MNDFDRFLERGLKQMLDPVVATPAPQRGGGTRGKALRVLAVETAVASAPVIPAAELVPVTVPVTAAPPL